MAETTAVFDRLVFSFGFDIVDVVPVILKVSVEPQYYQIFPGQEVVVTLYVINTTTTPGRRFLFNPAIGPAIEVYKPDGTVFLAADNMYEADVGKFNYIIHTEPTSPYGPYSAVFTAANGENEMVSRKHHIFTTSP